MMKLASSAALAMNISLHHNLDMHFGSAKQQAKQQRRTRHNATLGAILEHSPEQSSNQTDACVAVQPQLPAATVDITQQLSSAAQTAWTEQELTTHATAIQNVCQAFVLICQSDIITPVGNLTDLPDTQSKLLGGQQQLYNAALEVGTVMTSCYAAAAAACGFLDTLTVLASRARNSCCPITDLLLEFEQLKEQAVQQQLICSTICQAMQQVQAQTLTAVQHLTQGLKSLQRAKVQESCKQRPWTSNAVRLSLLGHLWKSHSASSRATLSKPPTDGWHPGSAAAPCLPEEAAAFCYVVTKEPRGQLSRGPSTTSPAEPVDLDAIQRSCKQLQSAFPLLHSHLHKLQAFWSKQADAMQSSMDYLAQQAKQFDNTAALTVDMSGNANAACCLEDSWQRMLVQFYQYYGTVEDVATKLS